MTNEELCLALMRADSELEVVELLESTGHWDNPVAWRFLGDRENNFSSIGNQQSEPVAALIEKLVNGIDARLTNACLMADIDPTSPEAPTSIRQAVATFFDGKADPHPEADGRIANWSSEKLTEQGRLLTLAATGHAPSVGQPSLSIADQGEGQEPDAFPDTFMSLMRSNKLRVHFVQGKFNMGGTGALQYCGGKHKFQLVVSRRNPALVATGTTGRALEWGFTIVRRERPQDGGRSSVFTYLAPVGADPKHPGNVLSFPAATHPIFPEADAKVRDAYARHAEYGSLVKLYEYEWQGPKSNVVMTRGGLLRRIDSGLPELGLPVRVYECRPNYSGHAGSFSTNVLGIAARLEKDKADTLEDSFPVGGLLSVGGSPVRIRIYGFKSGDAAKAYRTAKQGIVFTVNGQSHATIGAEFFRRKKVGMSYLADSLFVLVDCSNIDEQAREELFMNSRDRLRDTPVSRQLEAELETMIATDEALRTLRNKRRAAELANKLEDSKPLTNILQDLLKRSPSLSRLFLLGMKVPSPFPPGAGVGSGAASQFEGKPYPTYFRFRGMSAGDDLERDAHVDSKARIALETDAEDDYFGREVDRGAARLLLDIASDGEMVEVTDWQMRGPRSGVAHLTVDLPSFAAVGDELVYRIEITDDSRVEPFVNIATLRILPAVTHTPGTGGDSRSKNTGEGNSGGGSTLALPNVTEVEESEWPAHGFTELTALRVVHAGDDGDGDSTVYDFYVNVDNKFLRTAQKESSADPKLLRAQFKFALVLVGLSLLQDEQHLVDAVDSEEDGDGGDGGEGLNIETLIERATSAISPVLLPMIDSLSQLAVDEDDA